MTEKTDDGRPVCGGAEVKVLTRAEAEDLLRKELDAYQNNGCMICLNGRPSSPEWIARTCVREKRYDYMRDIISDGTQHIRKINFIPLSEGSREERRDSRKRPASHSRPR